MTIDDRPTVASSVRIVGVGGAGGKVINRLIDEKINSRFNLLAVNTDMQALMQSKAKIRVQLGDQLLRGNGVGGDPDLGKRAAEEKIDELYEVLHLAETVYIVAGMGGGTGSGAAPVIARIAQEQHARTVVVASIPFTFEGVQRQQVAESSLRLLGEYADELVKIRHDSVLKLLEIGSDLQSAFNMGERVLTWEVIRQLLP